MNPFLVQVSSVFVAASLKFRPETSGLITEFCEHEADLGEAQERERLAVDSPQSLANFRQRFSQAMVRLMIQRWGKTTNPLI